MPAPYSAGSIFLQVVPSFRGVPEEIQRQARDKWADAAADGFDPALEKRMRESGKKAGKALGEELQKGTADSGRQAADNYTGTFRTALRRGLANAQRELNTTPLKLVLNDEALRSRLDKLRTDIKGLDRKVELGTDATGAFIELRRVLGVLEDVQRQAKNVEVRSDVAAIHRDLTGVAKHIQSLSNVDIEPNLKIDRQLGTFERRLKAGIKAALDSLPPLNIDDGPAYAKVEALRERLQSLDRDVELGVDSSQAFAEVAAIEAAFHTLADTGESMKLRVDGASGFKTIATMRAELESLSRITIEPEVQLDRQLGAFERGIKGAISNALRDLGATDVGAGSSAGQRAVADLRRQLIELGDARIGVDISAETARARLELIRDQLERLQAEHWSVDVDADTAAASAQLAGFLAALEAIDGRHVDIDIDVRDAVSARTQINALEHAGGRLSRTFREMIRNSGGLHGALRRTSTAGQDGANSFRAFNARVLGVAALGPLVVPAIGAMAGAIAGLAVLGVAAGAALGVLILGLVGVGSAFKAMGKASETAEQDMQERTKRIQTASRATADAERALGRARADAARANEDASRRVQDALRGVEDAERELRSAQQDAQDAQEDLTRARAEAAEQLEDLQLRVRGGAIDERQAVLDLREAERELADARREGLSGDELERYIIALDRAKLRVDETKESNGDLREEQARWAREGIEGSDTVVAAHERVQDAQERIADAERGLADAQRSVADARLEQARSAVDAQQAISDAQRNLIEAQEDYRAALDETSTSQRNLRTEMEKLGPAGQEFVRWLDGMRPRFQYLRSLAQEGFLPGLQDWLGALLNDQGPRLERMIVNLSGALGDMFSAFATSIRGESFSKLFDLLATSGPRLLGYLTDSLVNAGEGFAEFIVAMEPLGDVVGGWLLDLTQRFKDWATSIQGTQELQDFFDYVVKAGPVVGELLWAFVEALINLGKAISPFAFGLADALTGFFQWLADLDPGTLGPILVFLTGLVVALQAVFAISSGLLSLRVAAHLTGIALGGLLGSVAKIGGIFVIAGVAFATLYANSETFRKAINTLWQDVLVPLFGFLADVVGAVLEPLFGLLGDNIEVVAGLAAAWAGWKILTSVAGWVRGLAIAMGGLSAATMAVGAVAGAGAANTFLGGAGRAAAAGAALGRLTPARAIPAVAATWAAWELQFGTDDERVNDWSQTLLAGGAEAEALRGRRQDIDNRGLISWSGLSDVFTPWDEDNAGSVVADFDAAQKAADSYWRTLPLVEQAQMKVAEWSETLAYRTRTLGENHEDTRIATERHAYWTGILEGEQGELATSTSRLNEALVTQQSLTIALTDAEIAYSQARNALNDSYDHYVAVLADANSTEEERRTAEEQWTNQARQTAEAARQVALTRHQNADAAEREAYGNAALLLDLERQKEQYGQLPPRLEELRASLAATVDPTILAVSQMENLGLAVLGIPDEKTVVISGDTPQKQLDVLRELGFEVERDHEGNIVVTANTDDAALILDEFINTEREVHITAAVDWMASHNRRDDAMARNHAADQQWPSFNFPIPRARGGAVFGPGSWTSDSIPAYLSNGEYVVRAASVAKYGLDFFDALNEGRLGQAATGFSRGGRAKRKNGRAAFNEGGLAVNWGGSMNLSGGDVSPLAAGWWEAVAQINAAAITGVGIMARALSTLASLARVAFAGISADINQNWKSLITGVIGATTTMVLTLTTAISRLRFNITLAWAQMALTLITATQNLVFQQLLQFARLSVGVVTAASRTASSVRTVWQRMALDTILITQTMSAAVDRQFVNLSVSVLRTVTSLIFGIKNAFDRLPRMLATPVNMVIDRVINRGLITAFNGIVAQLGTGAKPLTAAAGVKLATGGRVPGTSPNKTADNIPAWLTAGEYVHPVDSVDYYGPEVMEAIRKRRIPREMFSTMGYASGGYVAMGNLIKKQFPFARITSGYRPGDPGYHGKGLAIDIGGSVPWPDPTAIRQMLQINHWIARSFANITELIHTQPGAINLWHGQPHRYSAATALAHRNHVHWAQAGNIVGGGGVFPGMPGLGLVMDPRATLNAAMNEGLKGFGTSPMHDILRAVPTKLSQYMAARLDSMIQSAAIAISDQGIAAANLGGGSRAANRTLAQKLAAARGWVGGEWSALDRLIMKESGYNHLAQNPTSTAFGIGQFLNSTWATVGGTKTTDPGQQLEYMYRYIGQRYQTPSKALAFHLRNNYYGEGGPVEAAQDFDSTTGAIVPDLHDTGGWLMPGLNVIMNRTGRPEPTINPQTLDALHSIAAGGGAPLIGAYHQTVVAGSPREALDETLHRLDAADLGGRYSGGRN